MQRLSVLSVHNSYTQAGGEDRACENEVALLEQNGHAVLRFKDSNRRINKAGIRTAAATVWSKSAHRRLQTILRSHRIDVVHCHNTFPLISPSAYYGASGLGIPVVQTLHNYRLLCPAATLWRNGGVCEECVSARSLVPAVIHKCYRNDRLATVAVASMLGVHRALRTYEQRVDAYIALSRFAREKLTWGGLPPQRIYVKPNCLSKAPAAGGGTGGYALFVGRLCEEKGVGILAEAWKALPDIPLLVAGDGPAQTCWPRNVTALGAQGQEAVTTLMQNASLLAFPSTWYECAPMTILEALACGTPVIASDLGSIPEFVRHGYNGLLFRPGDPEDLARQVRWAFDHPEQLRAMRANARREFEEKYTAERNYKMLIAIYEQAIENARRR
jgi:glycosyltransferase involved in cell wall biosynthesis